MIIVFVFTRLIILLFLPLLLISISSTRISAASFSSSSLSPSSAPGTCHRGCGNKSQVQYPFGFSPGCDIQLNCTGHSGEITIGQFQVQNVTGNSLLIHLPPNCSRKISDLNQLEGPNFAMTRRNGLLFDRCRVPVNGCAVPMTLLNSTLDVKESCSGGHDNNTSCYSGASKNSSKFFDSDHLKQINCTVVYSSIAVALDDTNDDDNRSSVSTALLLNFQTLELGWWLDGPCNCHESASCTNVSTPRRRQGYRCRCKEGFVGDGFADGGGCKRASTCNASRYMPGRCGGTTKVGILVGGIIAGASLMVVLSLFYYCIRKRSKLLKSRMSAKRLLGEAAGSSGISFYPYKDIEKATLAFSDKQRLGTGAYGTVYAGKLHNDEWVAIKKIKHRDHESIEQVMNEIKLLSAVSHPNLVRLLGCCIEDGEQILVYEFMPNGTLSQHLQRERGSGLPWTIRLDIATETARAIAHLHSAINPPIYHRDIKSSNILLDYNYKSKVADFGLSRFGMMDDSHVSTAPQGTPGYLDPQYHQNFHLSDKSDVYSFGVVLVEIITALKVVDFSRAHSEINLAALAIERIGKGCLDEIIDPFLEPHRDAWTLSSIHKVAELAFRCLAFHRDMRPSMMEVADELEQIRLSGWAPLDENICMASSAASSCSSPFNGSEKSFNSRTTKKKTGVGSRRTNVSRGGGDSLSTTEETKDSSPVSVQDPWLSEQDSPSTNSLLSNIVH
ncbi:wall-associated receptor kinase-like 14 [Coffea eugenioides]|uniref:wall-associated receptor kinase-like 14 n=1 Tax=Coffea eugenioides TaxID=49369 RepID=UPI000F60C5B4|nr:wall-associated receptor kinase-like 14 [Coffea eugenioides]